VSELDPFWLVELFSLCLKSGNIILIVEMLALRDHTLSRCYEVGLKAGLTFLISFGKSFIRVVVK
jgi:hypothetical protein